MALTTIIPNLVSPFKKPQTVSHLSNGISTDIHGVQFPLQVGVPVQNIYTFRVIPAPVSNTCVAQAASYFGSEAPGGFITLNTSIQGTGANITAKPFTFLGQQGLLLDCERTLQLNFSTVTLVDTVVTIRAYDYRGVPVVTTTNLDAGSGSAAIGLPVTGVMSIYFSVNPFSGGSGNETISAGTTGFIGLPYYLRNLQYIISSSWNEAAVDSDGGTIIPGFNWRGLDTLVDINSCARGFVNVGDQLPDGSKQLVITYYVSGSDSELNAEVANLNQSSLKIAGIHKTASSSYPNPVYVYPYLIDYDLTGIQINPGLTVQEGNSGDSAFYLKYYNLCNA